MEAVAAWNDVFESTGVPAVMERPKKGLGWPSLRATFRQPRYSPKCLEEGFSDIRNAIATRKQTTKQRKNSPHGGCGGPTRLLG